MKLKPSLIALIFVCLAVVTGRWLAGQADGAGEAAMAQPSQQRMANAAPVLKAESRAASLSLSPAAASADRLEIIPMLKWVLPKQPKPEAKVSTASRSILATATLPQPAFPDIRGLKAGQPVRFTVDGEVLDGVVNLVLPDDAGRRMIGGALGQGQPDSFALGQDLHTGAISGHLISKKSGHAYALSTEGNTVRIDKRPIGAAMCLMPRYHGKVLAAAASPVAAAAAGLPLHESLPGAVGVVYLDFDGETVTDPDWNNGITINALPATLGLSPITAAQITDVWSRVAEDFLPFEVNVTTDRAKYDAAPVGHRALVIITPTDAWFGGYAGGVAYYRSYRGPAAGFSSTIPCWVWNNNSPAIMAMTISHELGHMFDLQHDGTSFDEYYSGHDFGLASWGPIMGAPFDKSLVQWSKGEYPDANNTEDDFEIISATIAEPALGNSYIADDVGDDTSTAAVLAFTSPIHQNGMISGASDVDFFSLNSAGGSLSVAVQPTAVEPNLDAQLEVYDETGTLLATSTILPSSLGSTLSVPTPIPGTYYIAVRGRGRPTTIDATGYTNYGSTGAYTLNGIYQPLPEMVLFTDQPASQSVLSGTKVTLGAKLLSNSAITYQWYRVVGAIDVPVPGKTASTLVFTSVKPADAGDYKLLATNTAGTVPSDVATLEVRYKPIISTQPSPANQTVATGSNVTLAITAASTPAPAYQWKKNGAILSGEISPTLTLLGVDWFDIGSYTVVVSNTLGSVTSSAVALTVASAPIITLQPPANKHIALGGSGSVSVGVVGTGPLAYQWFKDSQPIPKATRSTFTWAATKAEATGFYFLRVTGPSLLGFTDSTTVAVDVQDRPAIITQPQAVTNIAADQMLTLSCAASGTAALTYQWQFNGAHLADSASVSGSSNSTLVITPISWFQRGKYRCVVTNDVGTAITKDAVVNLTSYPVILTQPVPLLKIAKNGTGRLIVVAGGSATLKYQWFKGGAAIAKATSATLTLTKASVATTNDSYTVQVTNTQTPPLSGVVTSHAAMVVVEDPPAVTPPVPLAQIVGVGDTVTITSSATGSPTLTYQWQKNNGNIAGETSPSLVLSNVATTASGAYRLVVKNDVGTTYSKAATLTVQIRPTITQEPATVAAYAYDAVTFSVKATGSPTLKYQWSLNGNPLTTNTTAKAATLKLTSVQAVNAGSYTVTVSNAVGSATSTAADLTVASVPAPTVTDARPNNVIVGSKILAVGTNLNWTTKVTINGKNASFIKNRSNELMITVPSGIAATGSLIIETYGGTVLWPNQITLDKDGAENDNLYDAKFLIGTKTYQFANNSTATYQSGDRYYTQGKTIWYRWRAPVTSSSVLIATYGGYFDKVAAVFSGPITPVSGYSLTFITSLYSSYFYSYIPGRAYIPVVKGTEYYIMVDSVDPPSGTYVDTNSGWVELDITVLGKDARELAQSSFDSVDGFTAGASLAGQAQWQTSGGEAAVTAETMGEGNEAAYVGGEADSPNQAVSAWLATGPADTSKTLLRASVDLVISTAIGTDEEFSWSLGNGANGMPISLIFGSKDGSIYTQQGTAERVATGQVFVPDVTYHAEFHLDTRRHTWSMSLDGTDIAEGTGMISASRLSPQLGAHWGPAIGAKTGGVMSFDNVSLIADEAPAATLPASLPASSRSVP